MQETKRSENDSRARKDLPGKTVGIYDRPKTVKSSRSLATGIVLVLIVAVIAGVAYRFLS